MKKLFSIVAMLCFCASVSAVDLGSVYTQRPDDSEAIYFTPENFGFEAGGKSDVSDALQQAIYKVKREKNFGILFIPEGKYRISKTIYVPGAVRIIGYGKTRPEFILTRNSAGFDSYAPNDKGKAKYMFWFTGGIVEDETRVGDANAGTFYSALSNIDLRIEEGNPTAVALRTHYAQHSFISHVAIHIGSGKAGLFDVGNEMENVAFFGGDYGIYTTKASPGWQVMMVDSYFEGQRKAALGCQESGLAMVNIQVRDVPVVFDIDPNYADKLFVEKGRFENVSDAIVVVSNENNSNNQLTFREVECRNVPVVMRGRRSGEVLEAGHKTYIINDFGYGLAMDDMHARPEYRTVCDIEPIARLSAPLVRDIPALPPMERWVNLRDLGAKGDDVTDDTDAIQAAVDKYDVIYVPQGWYKVSRTIKMRPNTVLIGLHPFGTQFRLAESTPAFSGFGAPVAMLESSKGGADILNGIGMNTGAYNYRAVAVKWQAGADSYINDVKFVGGHGGMRKPDPKNPDAGRRGWGGWGPQRVSTPEQPVTESGKDLAWDNQYWSLWITGGGRFKDIWTASTYAANGLYVENTSVEGRIYAMSIEHHVRNEVRFKNVSNWRVYAMQLEEESRESTDCQPVELDGCRDMIFAQMYMFRVIRINEPYPQSIRLWNCRNIELLNIHNYSQIKYTTDLAVYDIGKDIEVRPWEFQRLLVTGDESASTPRTGEVGKVEQLGRGFEFAEGLTRDSRGNVYFCDMRMRRIYKYSVEDESLSLVADFPWKPYALACDTQDNLLVLCRYDAQPGYEVDGRPESQTLPVMPREQLAGTSFSSYGNTSYTMMVYSIDPENPEESIAALPRVKMGSVKNVAKALYVSNKWRDFHDFNSITVAVPEMCFVAPDGVTIIPHCFDLARGSSLLEAVPGRPFYTSDEYDRRMVRCSVAEDGTLGDLEYFVEWGEFGSAVDSEGNLYVADGNIYVFDSEGNRKGIIDVPERPMTLCFGGRDGNTLFITGRTKLFSVRIK